MSAPKITQNLGHVFALLTILIWGTAFISTKVLLTVFSPIEILFTRFIIGYFILLLIYPHRLKLENRRQEWLFVGAGVSGIALYYLLENIALSMTTASNVGIIVTIAPFFTAIFSTLFLKTEKPKKQFYAGFGVAIAGIAFLSFNGDNALELNPMGDILALFAAMIWTIYTILTRKISDLGYNMVQTTRRVFFYGILFISPLLFSMDFNLQAEKFASSTALGNILFLGVCASALCFVTWNTAIRLLGAVKTSVYIYLVPVVTVVASVLILGERLTIAVVFGAKLTLIGLWLSETKRFERKRK